MELINDFFKIFTTFIERYEITSVELSNSDKELSACYHKIEEMKLNNVAKSHKAIKELQTILKKRRQVKMEQQNLTIIINNLSTPINHVKQSLKRANDKQEKLIEDLSKNSF